MPGSASPSHLSKFVNRRLMSLMLKLATFIHGSREDQGIDFNDRTAPGGSTNQRLIAGVSVLYAG
jgi:hypothetical protein